MQTAGMIKKIIQQRPANARLLGKKDICYDCYKYPKMIAWGAYLLCEVKRETNL